LSVKKFADIAPQFAAAARRREQVAQGYERKGRVVAARESYFIAALLWASAQWPLFENTKENIFFNERKVECYQKFIAYAPMLATWTIRPKIRSFLQYDFAPLFYFSLADSARLRTLSG
jgi:hypothetical protein